MHIAHDRARQRLDGVGQLDDLVAVSAAHPHVQPLQHGRMRRAEVHLGVVYVVRVHDAHNQLESVAPIRTRVVPVQVLGLLQHADVALRLRKHAGDVAQRQDGAPVQVIARGVEAQLEVGLDASPLVQPHADVSLLILGRGEAQLAWENERLLLGMHPRYGERHALSCPGQVGCP
eukprot:scaffold830_cov112-Isochrysis_galbana.AAC.3